TPSSRLCACASLESKLALPVGPLSGKQRLLQGAAHRGPGLSRGPVWLGACKVCTERHVRSRGLLQPRLPGLSDIRSRLLRPGDGGARAGERCGVIEELRPGTAL